MTLQASQDLAKLTWRHARSNNGRCAAMGDWQAAFADGVDAGERMDLALPAGGGEWCVEAAG